MCAHNASGHGFSFQAICTPYYVVTNIQARTRQYSPSNLREAHFARQLNVRREERGL